MTGEPAPLVPIECDLRDFKYMQLDVLRLRDSGLVALGAEAFRAAVLSWCVAWHQMPAGSLPDDDIALCRLLGYGRDLKGWRRIRASGGLHGYIKCSDGRLYHPVVAEKVVLAWKQKIAQRDRTAKARDARLSQKKTSGHKTSVTQVDKHSVTDLDNLHEKSVTASKGEGEGEGEKKEFGLWPAEAPPDPKAELWRSGLATVARLTGKPVASCRKFLGKLVDLAGGDHERLHGLINRADVEQPDDVAAWLTAAAKGQNGHAADLFADDQWGIRAWISSEPGTAVQSFDGGRREAVALNGWDLMHTAEQVGDAARFSMAWRGRWDALGEWLRAGIEPDTIIAAIAKSASWSGYSPPGSLNYFEKPVREAAGKRK